MTWVRKDDQMPIHRKVAPLSDAAYRLLDEAICWSSRNLSDGVVGVDDLAEISKRGKVANAEQLVARRLWHPAGFDCPSAKCPPSGSDGWVIHDYWDYNPSKVEVLAERKAKNERQQRWRDKKKGKPTVDGGGDASTNGTVDARVDASVDGAVDASRDALVTPAPSPPRPAPKEAGRGGPPRAPAARRAAAVPADGGRAENPSATHPPNGLGPEDPEALAREQAEIAADAEAKVAAFADLQRRSERGAAAARAAIRRPPKPDRPNGLAERGEATPDVVIPLAEPTEEPQP